MFLAPEMLRGEKYGHAIDWYALGAVLCATLLSKVLIETFQQLAEHLPCTQGTQVVLSYPHVKEL